MLRTCCLGRLSVCLSVCRSVRKLYCGKMADWIWMLFGMVSGVGRGMRVLDGWWSLKGKGQFWGEFGASHCNQWGHCCVVVRKCVNDRAVVWDGEWGHPRHWCIRYWSTCLKQKGLFGGFFGICTPIGLNGQNDVLFTQKCIRLVHEKLIIFPYGQ